MSEAKDFGYERYRRRGVPIGALMDARVRCRSMSHATLDIAVVGVALSVASLAWQAATFKLSGGRVEAVLRVGALTPDGSSLVSISPAKAGADWWSDIAGQGYDRQVIILEVHSTGRLPVTVTRWGLQSSEGTSLYPVANVEKALAMDVATGPALPDRLEVGEAATWLLDRQSVDAFLRMHLEHRMSKRQPSGIVAPLHYGIFGRVAP
jgi:hypothetical protein